MLDQEFIHPKELESAYLKVERAQEHILELELEIHSFMTSNPYAVWRDDDTVEGDIVYKLSSFPGYPPRILILIGEIVFNLRSALDHLAYQLVLLSGEAFNERRIYFPIGNSFNEFKRIMRTGEIKKINRTSRRRLIALKPYRSGNNGFWILNELSNRDKHRLLMGLQTKFFFEEGHEPMEPKLNVWEISPNGEISPAERSYFDILPIRNSKTTSNSVELLVPLESGQEVYRYVANWDFSYHQHLRFAFDIVFGEPETIEGQPIVSTLKQLTELLDETLEFFAPLFPN